MLIHSSDVRQIQNATQIGDGENVRSGFARAYPVNDKTAILNSQEGRVDTLSNAFGELLAQAGLRTALAKESTGRGRASTRKGIDVSFRSIRHTSVSLLKDAGIPDAVVMAIVGHSSSAMSHRYTHVGKESLAKAAATLPEL